MDSTSGITSDARTRRSARRALATVGKSGSKENSNVVKGNRGKIGGGNQGKNSSKGECGDKSNKGSNRVWRS